MREIIDIHPHVISPDTVAYPVKPIGGNQSKWSEAHPTSHEDLIAAMDMAGVARSVVVQASTAYGHDNRYLAAMTQAYPDRVAGVFSVDAMAGDAVERIRYWAGQGLVGMRLFTTGTTMPGQADWLGDPASYPAWDYASRTGLPICVQMQQAGIPKIRALLDRFPEAVVILDHMARPALDDGAPYARTRALWDLAEYPGVHLKLTIRNLDGALEGNSTTSDFLDQVMGTYGSARVAWGSNFPAAGKTLKELAERVQTALAPLSEADQAMILSGTAKKLYPALTRMAGRAA
ncbi:amidohydrolase family protein [Puniceibacterium confluentis]|uniref:amidohydrolase family protein n=1 Tax=Puniceibacterium confluentis TaxID=1958944 RepID=UPI0011B73FA9|nr:amidohydrolase family protein [Puniceibacterium confluentis]